jgi:selenide,water dikinase
MARSMRLGHCICDPKKPCPCDIFKEKNVCLCAGEQLGKRSAHVRLTQLVDNPGCASKIDQAALKRVLKGLPFKEDPRVLVGAPAGDDAGVYKLNGRLALVQTVDVFSPSVDDPYTFGLISAANSVSDIYAMGAQPLTALSILGFPIRTIPDKVMRDILRGGIDKMSEAGVSVIGGHSINDKEIKAGFAVTGLVDIDRIVRNAGVQPGDALILTKPIGTGIIAFAAQIGRAPKGAVSPVAKSMAALNKTASELMLRFGAHACTDITGFGLMGHLAEMARTSGADVAVLWDDVPLFPGVLACARDGVIPGAVERNKESVADRVILARNAEPAMLDVCCDAQTSGGLLIAVAQARVRGLLARLHDEGIADAAVVGRALRAGEGRVFLQTRGSRPIASVEVARTRKTPSCCPSASGAACCAKPVKVKSAKSARR